MRFLYFHLEFSCFIPYNIIFFSLVKLVAIIVIKKRLLFYFVFKINLVFEGTFVKVANCSRGKKFFFFMSQFLYVIN